MKRIIIALRIACLSVFIFDVIVFSNGCGPSYKEKKDALIKTAKYKHGEIVYIKPDSIKGVVLEIHAMDQHTGYVSGKPHYYLSISGGYREVQEDIIYEKAIINEN